MRGVRCSSRVALVVIMFIPMLALPSSAQINMEVEPRNAPVTSLVTQQFTAIVHGTANTAVTWYVDGKLGGTAASGTIDANGVYTPPATFVVGTHVIKGVSQADPSVLSRSTVYLVNYPGMYTNRNDNSRDGQNLQETVLTPSNVNVNTFGKVFSYPLDGGVHAQPLYVQNVNIPNPLNGNAGYHNVVYVATEHDSVFAFDADGKVNGPLWQVSFITPPTVVTIPGTCFEAAVAEIGITATPVIDPSTGTLYVEARTLENPTGQCTGTFIHKLHALDITSGQEKFGGPVQVEATVAGNGAGSIDNVLKFNPMTQNVRPGLLLSKTSADVHNIVFLGSASLEDIPPYHGWVLGYDSQTLAQKYVFCTTPNGRDGGIWQMGGGLAADTDGIIYASTGNGVFDDSTDYGQSILKLTPSGGNTLTLTDFFTPADWKVINSHDWDVSSGGVLLLPDQTGAYPHEMIAGGKEGTIYVIDRDDLSGYNANGDNIIQEIVGAIAPSVVGTYYGIWNTAGYFQNNVYIFGHNDYPKMFTLANGMLPTTATSAGTTLMKSPNPIFSANGSSDGIVWILQFEASTLWAFDPDDLTNEYYDTNQKVRRDKPHGGLDTITPMVANGRVYVATKTELDVYGLF
jgi:hypothetical protein